MSPYYQNELVKIFNGDSMEVMPTIKDITLVLCDPPYGLNKKMSGGSWGIKYKHGDMMEWDYLLRPEHIDLLLATGTEQMIWGANHYRMPPSRCWIAWIKPLMPTLSTVELAWTSIDAPAKYIKHNRMEAKNHPTEKPLPVMEFCLQMSRTTGLVCDPFLGSGTTAVACMKNNRPCVGIETSERHCETSAKRCEEYITGLSIDEQDSGQTLLFEE